MRGHRDFRVTVIAFQTWSYYYGHIDMADPVQKIPAAHFKAHCLALMDRVAQSGRPMVVTKHGKPVVQISRAECNDDDDIFGFLAGKGRIAGDIENTIPISDWNLPE
jgi:prevent-host-death family protein